MPTLEKYRKTYFALVKELPGVEDRHDLQERLTGKRSLREWTPADFDRAIAELQRWNGQHEDEHAHIRADKPHGVAEEGGRFATWNQCRTIEDLCDQIEWRLGKKRGASWAARRAMGPVAYACRHLLAGEEWALVRENLKAEHNQEHELRGAQWRVLPREKASALVQALLTMKKNYPRERGGRGV